MDDNELILALHDLLERVEKERGINAAAAHDLLAEMAELAAEEHKALKIVTDVTAPKLPKQPRYILSRSWVDKHLNSDDDLKYFEGGAVIK